MIRQPEVLSSPTIFIAEPGKLSADDYKIRAGKNAGNTLENKILSTKIIVRIKGTNGGANFCMPLIYPKIRKSKEFSLKQEFIYEQATIFG